MGYGLAGRVPEQRKRVAMRLPYDAVGVL